MTFNVGLRDNGAGSFDINLSNGGTSPTVALGLPDNATSFADSATLQLNFTGTDTESDTLEYNVQIDTVNTFDSSLGSDTATDTYPFSNVDGGVLDMDSVDAPRLCRFGETFMARVSGVLSNATFALAKVGTPPDTIVAKLYAITGTSGTNAKPTGSALVSSSTIVASSLPAGGNNITFDFSGSPYTLTAGLYYAVVVEYDSTSASVANHMTIYADGTTPTHDGNGVVWSAGLSLWGYLSSNQKIPFIVNVKSIVPLLSGFSTDHTGFSAGALHPTASGVEQTYTVGATAVVAVKPTGVTDGDTYAYLTFYESLDYSVFSGSDAISNFGVYSGTAYYNTFVFSPPAVPQGHCIASAILSVRVGAVAGSSVLTHWSGIDLDRVGVISDSNRPHSQTETTAYVNTNLNPADFTPGTYGDFVDVTEIVQELVNRAGWNPTTSDIGITGKDNGTSADNNIRIWNEHYNQDRAPILTINYVPINNTLSAGTYYWRVAAKDVGTTGTGNYGTWSSTKNFVVYDAGSGISQPVYIGQGTFQSGTSDLSIPVPTGLRNNDLMLLFVESANEATTTPSGWTQLDNSPQGTGTPAAAGGVMLEVFYKIAYGNEGSVTLTDTGNHTTAIIMAYRNVNPSSPINITTGSVDESGTTSMVFPSVTTNVKNTLIVLAAAMDTDAASTATMGTVTNTNLTSLVERYDETVRSGAGGGLAIAEGVMSTVGSTGVSTATGSTSVTHAYLTIALQGMAPTVRVVGQYRDDESMIIPTGSRTFGDGITNNVGLLAEYVTGSTDIEIIPSLENQLVGTDFSYTSNNTLRAIKQQTTDFWTSRNSGSMIYDSDNKRYVFFGGVDGNPTGAGTTRYNDVWVQYTDVPGQPWRKLTVTGTPPTAKNFAAATFVRANLTSGGALRSYMVIWGGATSPTTQLNEMHLLRLDTIGAEAWTTVTQTSAPPARSWISGHIVATPVPGHSNQNYVYLFGGWAASSTYYNGTHRCTIDVDSPSTTTWTTLLADGAGGNPPARSGAILDYKASTNKLYLFGGGISGGYVADFWEYDITGNTWTNTSPTGTVPTGTELPAGGYDSVKNRFWFTGGWTNDTVQSAVLNSIGYINNVGGTEAYVEVRANTAINTGNQAYIGFSCPAFTIDTDRRLLAIRGIWNVDSNDHYHYVIDLDDNSTSNMPVYGYAEGEHLTARDAAANVYNPDRNEWVMIGGFTSMYDDTTITTGHHSSDIWVYSEAANTWRYANKGVKTLLPHEGRIGCYDTTRKRILVFGGLVGAAQVSNEVWQLVADSNGQYKATKLATTGTPPAARWLGVCAYDAVHNRMLVGLGADDTSTMYNDMYSLSFTSSASGAWTTLSPTNPPTAVAYSAFFNKVSNNRLYVFGGATEISLNTVSNTLVYFDYSTTNGAWTAPTATGGTARRGAAFALDVANDTLIVWGGYNGSSSLTALQYFLLSGTTWTSATPVDMPAARRSPGSIFLNGKLYIFGGRDISGMWYNDTWQLTPNYGTPNNSTWTILYPKAFTPLYFTETGLTNEASYHWQTWVVEAGLPGVRVSYGGNAESAADYIVGHTGYINANTSDEGWTLKPVKVYIGGSWVIKPVKVYDGSGWILKG